MGWKQQGDQAEEAGYAGERSRKPLRLHETASKRLDLAATEDHDNRAGVADSGHLAMSSEGLGWAGLKFERRDSRGGSRDQPEGSPHHLIFLGLSSGEVVRETKGERIEHTLTPGCVLIIPARTPVHWKWSSRIGFSVLMLEPDVLDRVAREAFQLAPDNYRLAVAERRNDTAIANITGALASEALSRDHAGNVCATSLANILSVHLLRHYATAADGGPLTARAQRDLQQSDGEALPVAALRPVAQALQFIQENYARDLGLRDIAAAVHVSPFQLSRLFKQTLGVSPYQHVIQVRVNSARHLLAVGSARGSLAEIANAVGFADQSHLTRHFKRLTGVTPGQFGANQARSHRS